MFGLFGIAVGGLIGSIIAAVVGAIILIAIVRLLGCLTANLRQAEKPAEPSIRENRRSAETESRQST